MGKLATTYKKSNDMVSAKFRSSLLENKIMALGLTRIEYNNNSELEARLYPGELMKIVSDKNHIYRDLKVLSKKITGHTVVLEDGKGNFKAFSMIPNAEYQNGIFTIKFNNELKNHILGLEKNFTKLNLPIMTSFDNVNAFRLYELFQSEYYQADKNGNLDLEYNLSELKFIIGIANSDNEAHRDRLARMNNNIDWDALYAALDKKDKKYENWNDFKRGVLDPAKIELDEKADISFDYETGIKKGKKVVSVIFHLSKNQPINKTNESIIEEFKKNRQQEGRQQEMPRDLEEYKYIYDRYVGHNELVPEDIDLLIIKAKMDGNLVERAIEAADKQESLHNYMGWIIRYIERGGYEEVEVMNGDREATIQFRKMEKEFEEEKSSIAAEVWNKTKTKSDFNEFLLFYGFESADEFEKIYDDPDEAVKMYIDWKIR